MKLDSFHRRQLRKVIGMNWPHKISNKKLYEVTGSKPLSITITICANQDYGMEDARGQVPTTTLWDLAVYRSISHLAILHDRRFGLDVPWLGFISTPKL